MRLAGASSGAARSSVALRKCLYIWRCLRARLQSCCSSFYIWIHSGAAADNGPLRGERVRRSRGRGVLAWWQQAAARGRDSLQITLAQLGAQRPLTRPAPAGEHAGSGPPSPRGRGLGFEILPHRRGPLPQGRGLFFLMIAALSTRETVFLDFEPSPLRALRERVPEVRGRVRGYRCFRAAIGWPSATALGEESLAEKPRQGRQKVFVGALWRPPRRAQLYRVYPRLFAVGHTMPALAGLA